MPDYFHRSTNGGIVFARQNPRPLIHGPAVKFLLTDALFERLKASVFNSVHLGVVGIQTIREPSPALKRGALS